MTVLAVILQVAISLFAQNPAYSSGNLCRYFPADTSVTAPPPGYEPVYISHIARHGSRYYSTDKPFSVVDSLAAFNKAGLLTEEGIALMEDLRRNVNLMKDHLGELTSLGALEHRRICRRMYEHYPAVFGNPARRHIDAFSTGSGRVLASRESFLLQLNALAPDMEVTNYKEIDPRARDSRREVRGHVLSNAEKDSAREGERSLSHVTRKIQSRYNFDSFASRIFIHPERIPEKRTAKLAAMIFPILKSTVMIGDESLQGPEKYFSPEELYLLWVPGCLGWAKYLPTHNYIDPFTIYRGGAILDCMVRDADEALSSGSSTAATLRFSHDSYLIPLMAAMGLDGTFLDCSDSDIPDHFQDFRFVCGACNVQLVFFRNGEADVLVKFLLNEAETLITGLQPVFSCYYKWNEVKELWQNTVLASLPS